jgi:4-hydroxybenzoate polyprenyltransferase
MLRHIKNYSSLVKFSHTLFAMPFAFVGFFTATHKVGYTFDWYLLIKVVLCMVFARNAAIGFNRYIDREIDLKNARTSVREIPIGIINPNAAIIFVFINSVAFILTTFFINQLTFFLSPLALAIIIFYSYTKKISSLCHFVLGLGLSLAPIGAYLSVSGSFSWLPVMFSFLVMFWVSGFDIIYSLQDFEFDKKEKLKSIPTFLGIKKSLVISAILHSICSLLLLSIGILFSFKIFYWIGAFGFVGVLVYQHLIIKPKDLKKINVAFFTANGAASVFFALFYIVEVMMY